jgi:N-acetylglutamate synthase
MNERDLIQACEQRIVNCWPALRTVLMGDWVARLAANYSSRANSASPTCYGADLDETAIAALQALYHRAGQATIIRLTPLASPRLDAFFESRGWTFYSESIGQVGPLESGRFAADHAVMLDPDPVADWLMGVSRLQDERKRDAAALQAIVSHILLPKVFATIHQDGRAVGHGMAAIDRGMMEIGSIIVDESQRGQGMGRRLVETLLAWGAQQGAAQVFLQVEATNEAAQSLYRSLGLRDLYRYKQCRA